VACNWAWPGLSYTKMIEKELLPAMLLTEAIEALLIATGASGRSLETVKAYRRNLKPLVTFLGNVPVRQSRGKARRPLRPSVGVAVSVFPGCQPVERSAGEPMLPRAVRPGGRVLAPPPPCQPNVAPCVLYMAQILQHLAHCHAMILQHKSQQFPLAPLLCYSIQQREKPLRDQLNRLLAKSPVDR